MDIKIIKIGKIIDIMVFHVACPFSLSNSFFFKKNNVVKTDKNKEINIKELCMLTLKIKNTVLIKILKNINVSKKNADKKTGL